MGSNYDLLGGVAERGACLNTLLNDKLGTHGPGGDNLAAKAKLDRLKEIQRAYACVQGQGLSKTPAIIPSIGHQGSGGSASLLPPGPSSPHDSQAPALRHDAANTSNGSDPFSNQGGSCGQSLPGQEPYMHYHGSGGAFAFAGEPLAIPDLSDLPLDLPDMFGELDVPSLEDLVQDIGAAEAELMATVGLPARVGLVAGGAGGNGGGGGGINLLRSQTLPAPSTLPLPPKPNRVKLQVRRNSTACQASFPEAPALQQQPASGSDGSGGGAGVRRKRKSLEIQVETQHQEVLSIPFAAAQHHPDGAAMPSAFGSAAAQSRGNNNVDNKLEPHPSKKLEVDFILDDDALLERVANETSPFAGLSAFPLSGTNVQNINKSLELAPALSLPNRHWLSPAAAIHAMHASRPGDEDVIKWLVHGR
jgi:hypothetical protein